MAIRRPVLAFLFAVVALMLLSTIPYWTFRHIEVLRRDNDDVVEPARDLVARFELAVAQGSTLEARSLLDNVNALGARLDARSRGLIADLQGANQTTAIAAAARLHANL